MVTAGVTSSHRRGRKNGESGGEGVARALNARSVGSASIAEGWSGLRGGFVAGHLDARHTSENW